MKVIVIGPRGKMGKLITQVAASRDDMELVGAIAPKGRDYIGKDLGTVTMTGFELGVPVTDDLESIIDFCDVIIDFSTKEMAMEVLDLAIAHKKALVCGSTGFSAEEMKRFEEAGKQIPMLYAANTSKLVNIMNKLLISRFWKCMISGRRMHQAELLKRWVRSWLMLSAKSLAILQSTDVKANHLVNLEPSAIIPFVPAIFQAAIPYTSEAWANVWKLPITPITGNALQEEPVTVLLILKGKALGSIPSKMCLEFNPLMNGSNTELQKIRHWQFLTNAW